MNNKLTSHVLLITAISAVVLGLLTLVPFETASKNCLFGYLSLCPFAPASTALCLMGANIIMTLRKKYFLPVEK